MPDETDLWQRMLPSRDNMQTCAVAHSTERPPLR
jgi:hypothetical protein